MKLTRERSWNYWQSSPDSFSELYQEKSSIFSPETIVGKFLKRRTEILYQLLDTDKSFRLLDVGCGSGVHLVDLLTSFKEVVGVDYSQGMLDIAAGELKKTKRRNWQLINADAARLPLKTNYFDRLIAMGLLDYVQNPTQVLKEFRRVVKKGGQIIFSLPKKPSLFSPLRSPLGILIKKYVFHLPPIDNTLSLNELLDLLAQSRFTPEKIESVWTAMWMVKAKAT